VRSESAPSLLALHERGSGGVLSWRVLSGVRVGRVGSARLKRRAQSTPCACVWFFYVVY
jgi:hypothetical protein